MKKIIGIGNALVDVLVRLDAENTLLDLGLPKGGMQLINQQRYDEISQSLSSACFEMATGGSAGNTILALASMGARVGFVGKIGQDELGDFYAQRCYSVGVEAHLQYGEQPTGVATTFVTPDGERTFATFLGAAALMDEQAINEKWLNGYDILYVEGYLVQSHSFVLSVMQRAKKLGMKICIDLASYNVVASYLEFFRMLVRDYVDIVFANEEEAEVFTQESNGDKALEIMATYCDVAVLKQGAQGAKVRRGAEIVSVSAIPVDKVVDTTAAGDFFAGGFLYAYAQGYSMKHSLQVGALLGTAVIQVMGTNLVETTWNEIRLKVQDILHK